MANTTETTKYAARPSSNTGVSDFAARYLEWIDIGTTAAGAVRKAVALAAGFQSICVLGDDGVVKCWGTNRSGELGLGTLSDPRSCSPDEMGNAGLVTLPAAATGIAGRFEHACT